MSTRDLDRLDAEAAAAGVLKSLDMDGVPVDPMAIAAAKGILVEARTLDGSGALVRLGNDFVICYSDRLGNKGFERFTVAHELGHYCLDGHIGHVLADGDMHISRSGAFDRNDRIERQADCFAAALLMPEGHVRRILRERGPRGFPQVEAVARACRVSTTAAAIRFATFAEDPVAVVLSKGRTVSATFLSDPLAARVRPLSKGRQLPPASATFRFNTQPAEGRSGRTDGSTFLDHWFDDAPSVEMSEDVVGLGQYGLTLTVLFTEEALDDEDDRGSDDD